MSFWHQITDFCSRNGHYLGVLVMPLAFGALGWFSNWKCIKMMFYPLHFWGIPPYLGWQGLVPRNAAKFAGKTCDLLTKKLVNVDEVFNRLDARRVAKELEHVIDDIVDDAVNEIFESSDSLIWRIAPEMVKNEIIKVTRHQVPRAVRLVMKDISENIFDVFNLRELALECMTGPNVNRMRYMFQTIGRKEFKFLERLGFYIGFALGIVQTALWYVYPASWTVPVQGAIVGGLTNWLALQMVFRPLEPKKFLFFTYQGLFLKRRPEVTREFSKLVCQEVLTSKNILRTILMGAQKERIHLIIRISISQTLDRLARVIKPVIMQSLKADVLDVVQYDITLRVTNSESMQCLEAYFQEALDVENVMIDKFKLLTMAEFEDVLRSVFREDEWMLIAVGVALGLAVGFLHFYIV
jgi:uncharacterized membrane protein YheB (UPF0754 family)